MTVSPLYPAEKYTYRVLWSEERQRYIGVCTEFPDLNYEAKAHALALNGVIARVRDELEILRKAGNVIPDPIGLHLARGGNF
jgi:hypothetical protein